MLKIKNAHIIKSATSLKDAPKTNLPELVMIGRSNVGKSSFINVLCNRKNLAYRSKTPGKTRLINLYNINDTFILTDLPGYGYAKRSKEEMNKWQKILEDYLVNRKEIICAIQLIDSRHEIQKNDLQMRQWLEYHEIPILTVLTKVDYLAKYKVKDTISKAEKNLSSKVIGFSARSKLGKDDILKEISSLLNNKDLRKNNEL